MEEFYTILYTNQSQLSKYTFNKVHSQSSEDISISSPEISKEDIYRALKYM